MSRGSKDLGFYMVLPCVLHGFYWLSVILNDFGQVFDKFFNVVFDKEVYFFEDEQTTTGFGLFSRLTLESLLRKGHQGTLTHS